MKAHRRDTDQNGSGSFHGEKIRLSIGLIVKNEEKTLDQCLNSLLPLLGAVSSELIITDTGSSDHTVEIAEKYTDHIIHYKWRDDFSEARNTGLKEARGEWFLFLDADEWFDDVTRIIDFFNSGECDRYGSAAYNTRNYTDQSGETYTDFCAERLFRIYPGIHFENKVHEAIRRAGRTKFLDAYVHHYGYAYKDREDQLKKFRRNTGLLENILEENPNDLRALWELAKEYMPVNVEKAIALTQKGLELEKNHPDGFYRVLFQHELLRAYFTSNAYQNYLETVEEILALPGREEIDYLDFYFWGVAAAFKSKQYSKAILFGQKYLKINQRRQKQKLDPGRKLLLNFYCLGLECKEEIIRVMGWCYLKQNNWEQAYACLKGLDLSIPHWNVVGVHSLCFAIAWFGEKWEITADFYDKILSCNSREKKAQSIDCMEENIRRSPALRLSVYSALSKMKREDDFVILCRLRCAEEAGEQNTAIECLNWFSEHQMSENQCFSDVLYFAAKEKMSLLPFINKIDPNVRQSFIDSVLARHPDFSSALTGYFRSFLADEAKEPSDIKNESSRQGN
jgi:glycosyltransferase involved in cell wall biosynthesis